MEARQLPKVLADAPEHLDFLGRVAAQLLVDDPPSIEPDAAELIRSLDPRAAQLREVAESQGEVLVGYRYDELPISHHARDGLQQLLSREPELRPLWGWLFAHRGTPQRRRRVVEDVQIYADEDRLEQQLAAALAIHIEERY